MNKKQSDVIKKAIKKFPFSMSRAAKSIEMPLTTFSHKAKELGIYNPNPYRQNIPKEYINHPNQIDLQEILDGKHPSYGTHALKVRLIKAGIKKHQCENKPCELSEWYGVPIPLELNHINGVNNDHRLKNVELLCPNCHALKPTNSGKNTKIFKSHLSITDQQIHDAVKEAISVNHAIRISGYKSQSPPFRKRVTKEFISQHGSLSKRNNTDYNSLSDKAKQCLNRLA